MISEDVLSTEYLGQEKLVNEITPVVSVCVITYNHAPYIRECLDSILMQETDFPFEIIIGEDNSTDGTRDICKEYADKHQDKIRLFLRRPDQKIKVNGKKTFHFNFIEVLNAAIGDYIAFCEGDDYWLVKDKLQDQYNLAVNYYLDAVFGRTYHLRNDTQYEVEDGYFETGKINLTNVNKNQWLFGHTSTFFVSKANILDALNDTLLLEAAGANNVVFYHAIKNNNVGFIKKFLSVYRHHSGGITKSLKSSSEFDLHAFNKYHVYASLYSKSRVLRGSLAYYKNLEGSSLIHCNFLSIREKAQVLFYVLSSNDRLLRIRLKKSFKKKIKQIMQKI